MMRSDEFVRCVMELELGVIKLVNMKCNNCSSNVDFNVFKQCWKCGADENGKISTNHKTNDKKVDYGINKYYALNTIAFLSKLLAILYTITISILLIFSMMPNKYGFDNYVREVGKVLGLQPSISFLYIALFIIQSLVTILSLFGLSELIKLLLSIEKKR